MSYYIRSYCRIRNRSISINGHSFMALNPSVSLNDFLRTAYRRLNVDYPKFYKMDGLCKAVFIAAELMVRQSGPFPEQTALIFSNRTASYLSDSQHAAAIQAVPATASPATFVYTLPNIAMGELSIRHRLYSENVFFIFENYFPEFLVSYVDSVLDGGKATDAISGWTEVTEQRCDLFLYHVGTTDGILHTHAAVNRLYNEEHERTDTRA